MVKSSVKLFSNYEYKKQFLPGISRQVLVNNARLQLYRIEHYLRNIVIPVIPYRTSFNFLIFVTRGHIRQQLEVASHHVSAGSLLLIKQGSITATLEISPDASGFFVVFENEVMEHITLNQRGLHYFFSAPFFSPGSTSMKWMRGLCMLLEEELKQAGHHDETALSLFQAFLQKILRHENPQEQMPSRILDISFRFREMVQQHHGKEKSVLYYARRLNISENYLNKCVKEATGKPPKQWITKTNILHSQILLQDMQRDVASIAFELNFQSASYFTRLFRKVTGISPTAYRKSIMEEGS